MESGGRLLVHGVSDQDAGAQKMLQDLFSDREVVYVADPPGAPPDIVILLRPEHGLEEVLSEPDGSDTAVLRLRVRSMESLQSALILRTALEDFARARRNISLEVDSSGGN